MRSSQPKSVVPKSALKLQTALRLTTLLPAFFCVGLTAFAQQSAANLQAGAAVGTVTGSVLNVATGTYLADAIVTVPGTNQSVATDRQGRYELRLPAGPASLVVTYTGLNPKTVAVNVTAGSSTIQNIELNADIYTLEAFNVSGPREGNALAITRQQQAPNVKNVVASDTFGNVADGNVGDFLQQLPGISAVYVGADVRAVQIRGIDANLNSVTMDGDRVASSQSAGLGRQFEFEQASLGLIETIEVTKAPTPDMDADSIGGNVNMITKSPFDRAVKRYFNYAIGGVYRPDYMTRTGDWTREPLDHIGPSLNFTYADRLGKEERLGILLTGTYHSQPGGNTLAAMNYQNTLTEPYYIYSVSAPRPQGPPRTRFSTGFKVDYQLSDRTIITFNTSYNWFHESADTRTRLLTTGQAVANFVPGYSGLYTEVRPVAASRANVTAHSEDKSGRTYQFAPSVRHRFPTMEIDYGATYSNSQTYYEYGPAGRHHKAHPKGIVTMNVTNIGWIVDRREDENWPIITQTAGPDIFDLNNYKDLLLTENSRSGDDTIKSARFNFRKSVDVAVPTYFKVGASFREQERQLENHARRYNYYGPDGRANSGDEALAQFLDTSERWKDTNRDYRMPAWPDSKGVAAHVLANPNLWNEDLTYANNQKLLGNRSIVETVTSAYGMGNVKLNNLSILGGLRVEKTATDAEGPLQIGTVVSGRERREGEYQKVFPGVHFKYTAASGLVSRLSYTSSIGRPGFGSIIPLDTVNEVNESVTRSNPSLKPQFSDNFDLSVEYYFEPVGLLSASVFLKEISDFQFTDRSQLVGDGPDNGYDGQYVGYTIAEPRNGGSARYRGFELAYQQQFTFLPGIWRGLGLNLNYTQLETEGDYGGAVATTQLAGFVPKIGNVGLSYIGRGWSLRFNGVWRGTYLTSVNANAALLVYAKPRFQANIKLKYNLSRRLGFFCDVENINNAPLAVLYQGRKDRISQTYVSSPKIVAGVQGTF